MKIQNAWPLLAILLLLATNAWTATATQLSIVTGDGQFATAGTNVKGVVCVIVKDASNVGVSGVTVTWGSITGGGSLSGATVVTDTNGLATLGQWVLGPIPGANTITASSPGLPSVTFNATGVAAATHLSIAQGNNQSAAVGASVQGVVCVFALDAQGKSVAGVSVTFGSVSGGGSISGATQTTDENGLATLGSWTLGASPGVNTLTATSPGLVPVTFTATGLVPTLLAIASGNNQSAPAGSAVPGLVCAIVTDSSGTVVPGVTVTWGNVTGGGSIRGAAQVTGAAGIATLGGWTLGSIPGSNSITANAPGLQAITFNATGTSAAGDTVVIQWNNALLRAIRDTQTPSSVAARAIGMVHTGMFNAWAAYDPKAAGSQLGGTLRRPLAEQTGANKTTALSYAAYRILLDLFPDQQLTFDNVMILLNLDATNVSMDATTPAGIGNTAAAALLAFRHADGSNQLGDLNPGAYSDYTSYAPVNDPATLNNPSRWQPLLENGQTQQFVTPQWGVVTAFAIGKQGDRSRPKVKACATYPSKAYLKEAADSLALSAGLTDQQKTAAFYWDDGIGTLTAPGHWCQFAQYVSGRDKHTLDDDVKFFFALGNALSDASIATWDAKRQFDSIRPVSAIRFIYKGKTIVAWAGPGKGSQSIAGENFQSYVATPAEPEYVSEHSCFGAAAAAILTSFTGKSAFGESVTIAAGSSTIEANVPAGNATLRWNRFSDAVIEEGMSRRIGGVQFKDGDLQGQALGKKIGALVWKKAKTYFAGTVK